MRTRVWLSRSPDDCIVARVGSCVDAGVLVSTLGVSVFCPDRGLSWLLFQAARPHGLYFAVLFQLPRVDVCVQFRHEVVMTVLQLSVWHGLLLDLRHVHTSERE